MQVVTEYKIDMETDPDLSELRREIWILSSSWTFLDPP